MKYIVSILIALILSVSGVFADTSISLSLNDGEKTVGAPFEAHVVIEYENGDQLGEIFLDGLDNFTLVGEAREDTQNFAPSGAVNIIKISLALIPIQAGDIDLGPVTLYVGEKTIESSKSTILVKDGIVDTSTQYTPISSIYFQDKAFKVSTLKALTVLLVIVGTVIFLVMFWVYRRNLEMRKYGYVQVLYSLDAQADSKKAPKKFYTDIYNLFRSYLQYEKKTGFGGKNMKDMKNKLSKKEFDILDLVYNVEYNRSKDSPKYRKKILKALHKYFDKNIV
ncbi:hypothetical protein OAN96_00130 [Candidatus Gracilibacteria bacterium]|nr:hypothetical protein [Candidatus Gracilibacteria bacterium]